MIDPRHIGYGTDVVRAAHEGSPFALAALGRLVGLAAPERAELASSGVPTWVWGVVALGVGFVVGARVQKAYPRSVPRLIAGGR